MQLRTVPANDETKLDGAHRKAPDLDCSDVRESVRLLQVAVAQIDVTMYEGDASIAVMSGALCSITAGLKSIRQCTQESPSAGEPAQKGNVSASCSILAKKVEAAIMAIQFYDAMTQKLTHISENLQALVDFMADPGRVDRPSAWHALKQRTRARFTMESERRVFDALMRGIPMEEAVRPYARPNGKALSHRPRALSIYSEQQTKMNAHTAATKLEREFAFNHKHFELLRGCVREHTGIALSDGKRELVYGRLSRRLRNLGIDNFDAYCSLITAGDKEEIAHFVNAITTNLTAFFRESHHFDHLAALLPRLIEKNQSTRRLRIWSAGCSTGEEAYSIAITVRETIGDPPGWDTKILATDIDSNVLAAAANGVYHPKRTDGLCRERLSRWFLRGQGKNAGMVRVAPDLQKLITFRQLNLMQPWPLRGPFDVLFCRNVVIYFGEQTQRMLFNRFADVLVPGGHLFIGHSESLFKVSERFKLLGKTAYQRVL